MSCQTASWHGHLNIYRLVKGLASACGSAGNVFVRYPRELMDLQSEGKGMSNLQTSRYDMIAKRMLGMK